MFFFYVFCFLSLCYYVFWVIEREREKDERVIKVERDRQGERDIRLGDRKKGQEIEKG